MKRMEVSKMSVGAFILILIGMCLVWSIIDRILKLIENKQNTREYKNKNLYRDIDIEDEVDRAFKDLER
jgi:hypothetical protein